MINSRHKVHVSGGIDSLLHTFAHEIAHAYQDVAVQDEEKTWRETVEGKAYIRASEKDLEAGHFAFAPQIDEGAAETCALWWSKGRWKPRYENPEVAAPNRFKWAEAWLDKH